MEPASPYEIIFELRPALTFGSFHPSRLRSGLPKKQQPATALFIPCFAQIRTPNLSERSGVSLATIWSNQPNNPRLKAGGFSVVLASGLEPGIIGLVAKGACRQREIPRP